MSDYDLNGWSMVKKGDGIEGMPFMVYVFERVHARCMIFDV